MVESHGRWMFTFSRSCLFPKLVVPFYIHHQQCMKAVLISIFTLDWCKVPPLCLGAHVRELRMEVEDQTWRGVQMNGRVGGCHR